jgi:hypothetical protein
MTGFNGDAELSVGDETFVLGDVDIDASPLEDAIDDAIERELQAVERAIRGAILAGYDGVDINRPPPEPMSADLADPSITLAVDIDPWERPAPDAANGMRTERYTWDWFDQEELQRAVGSGDLQEIFEL